MASRAQRQAVALAVAAACVLLWQAASRLGAHERSVTKVVAPPLGAEPPLAPEPAPEPEPAATAPLERPARAANASAAAAAAAADDGAAVEAELAAGSARAAAHARATGACAFPAIARRARHGSGGAHITYRGMQLWVSHAHRFIFFRYQKVASTTSMVLARMYGAEMLYQGERWDGVLPPRLRPYYKFAFVRDPLARFVSSYNFRRPGDCRPPLPRCVPEPRETSAWHAPGGERRPLRARDEAVRAFASSIGAGVGACAHMDVHFHPQAPWLVTPQSGLPRRLDFIGVTHGEAYALGWKAVSRALALQPPVTDAVIEQATATTLRVGRAASAIPPDERGLLVRTKELSAETARALCAMYARDYACLEAARVPGLHAACAPERAAANRTAAGRRGGAPPASLARQHEAGERAARQRRRRRRR